MNGKLVVADVFDRVFGVYRDQFTLLVPAALIVFVPVAIVNGVLRESGGVGLALLAVVIGAIATYWFQGMVVEAAHDIMDGRRDHTVGSLVSSVAPVLGPLLVAGILGGLAIGIGFVLLIVPGLFLLTIWALLAPVIVVERVGAIDSFGRSRALVRGHGWQVFAVLVVLLLVKLVLSTVVAALAVGITDSVVTYALADLVTNVLIAPLSAIAAAVMYFQLLRLHGEAADAAAGAAAPAPAGGACRPRGPSAAVACPPMRVLLDRPLPQSDAAAGESEPSFAPRRPSSRDRCPARSARWKLHGLGAAPRVRRGRCTSTRRTRTRGCAARRSSSARLARPRSADTRRLPRRPARVGGSWPHTAASPASRRSAGWRSSGPPRDAPDPLLGHLPEREFEAFDWDPHEAGPPEGAVILAESAVACRPTACGARRASGGSSSTPRVTHPDVNRLARGLRGWSQEAVRASRARPRGAAKRDRVAAGSVRSRAGAWRSASWPRPRAPGHSGPT